MKPGLKIHTIDGPFYAPNKHRIVEVVRESDMTGAMLCKDVATGEELHIQKAKLLYSLENLFQPMDEAPQQPINPS